MARFEKGKPKHRRFWDIATHGHVLSVRDWGAADDRLRGYRAMASPEAARAEMGRLAAEKVAEGYEPADHAAKDLTARLPTLAPRRTGPPAFPIRQDLYVYNEGTGFTITSARLAGKGIENGGKKWEKAVLAGDLLPVGLIQDDPFLIRIIAGDELTVEESEEWVGRVDSHLKVPDGKLVVSAVAEYVEDGYEEGGHADQFVRTLAIPKGHYDATVYMYLHGINGESCLDALAGGYQKSERVGAWMRRTRAGVPFPVWIRGSCIAYPGNDPGHEDDWKDLDDPDDESQPSYVDFLLHLRPSEAKGKPSVPAGLEGGWFGETTGARKPERCPLGLVAKDVLGHEKEEGQGDLQFAQHTLDRIEPMLLRPLRERVEMGVDKLGEVFGVAWLAHPRTLPAIRAVLPAESKYTFKAAWPEGFVVFQDGPLLQALPTSGSGAMSRKALGVLGAQLKDLPDGTILEILAAPMESESPGEAGFHRSRGPVEGGMWTIEEMYPEVPIERLREALALASELNSSLSIKLADEAEYKAAMKWFRANHGPYAIEDNPPRFAAGSLKLKKPERGLLWLLATAVFALRFRDVFPVMDMGDDQEAEFEAEEAEREEYAARANKPIQGARLLEGGSGRVYFQSMALMVSEKLAAIIQERERELFGLKFRHVADVVCGAFPDIVLRGYARNDDDTWATYLVRAPETVQFELSSRFEKGTATLATLEGEGIDDPARAAFRQSMPGQPAVAMIEAHERRKNQLSAEFGAPVKLTINARGFAEAVEVALTKQFGS